MKLRVAYLLMAVALISAAGWLAWVLALEPASAPASPALPTTVVQAPTSTVASATRTPQPSATREEPGSLALAPDLETEPTATADESAAAPTASPTIPPSPTTPTDPFELISLESLFAYLEDLTAIQPYSGWRNSASEGEAQALDYVTQQLEGFAYLTDLGMELARQDFRVFLGTELWDTRLHLTVDDQEVEVPADGLRGPRDNIAQALRFDSDGALNDSSRDPAIVQGPVVLVRSADEIGALQDLQGKIVFLDYSAIDRVVQRSVQSAVRVAWELLAEDPAGLVLVTAFSNKPGESHGTFVSDVSALNWVTTEAAPPTLYVRLEDLAPAGIYDWADLETVEAARLTWDADVFSPSVSGNLVARIPGNDPSRAMILGAHIDSPNSPGALDDGSGSVILLEVARALNASQMQPPTDLYMVWFGSEELGLYGSSHFVATHQELLDRTQAMLQTDMLSYPLEGIDAEITLVTWSYGRLGDARLLWPEYLAEASALKGVETAFEDVPHIYSDNSSFGGFDVPHADLIYQDRQAMEATGSLHYAAHIHDPYDTVDLARQTGNVLEQMARVVLTAAMDAPPDVPALRVAPEPDRRALFVGSHTEPAHMTPAGFIDLGMALAMEGFDVDLIPYGQPVTAAALENTDMVIVLPVVDYPSPEGDVDLYDEVWAPEEIAALEAYAAEGGLLVLTNSANRLKYSNSVLDPNEDWEDMNALSSRFGIGYLDGTLAGDQVATEQDHPLMAGIAALSLIAGNSVPFTFQGTGEIQVLAQVDGDPAVALVSHGDAGGQVLILADVGMLGTGGGATGNLLFWQNLARYAGQ